MQIRSDHSERVAYDNADFPVYIRLGKLSSYTNYSAISHWHDDVEFIRIESGHMLYNINGKIIRIEAGEGIFVNTRQLHYGFSDDRNECIFYCLLIHPVLLCAGDTVEKKYIRPVLENQAEPYLLLHAEEPDDAVILETIKEICDAKIDSMPELRMMGCLYRLWGALYRLTGKAAGDSAPRDHHLSGLRDMISYIRTHYQEKITLAQICRAGNVGKTTCCTIFQNYTNLTPGAYLMEYRLQKGRQLLARTGMTVSEIAYETGFSGTSYFTESFRKVFGCTPTEYRKNTRAADRIPAAPKRLDGG